MFADDRDPPLTANLEATDAQKSACFTLKSGKLSYAKVRALTRVATPEAEAKLLEVAMYSTGAQLERLCRGYRIAKSHPTGPHFETAPGAPNGYAYPASRLGDGHLGIRSRPAWPALPS